MSRRSSLAALHGKELVSPRTNSGEKEIEVVSRGWEWAHEALWSDASEKKCMANMVDTLIFHPDRAIWLSTPKIGGGIVKKKESSITAANVKERFLQVACKVGQRTTPSKYVAFLLLQNGSRRLIEPEEFQDWLEIMDVSSSSSSPTTSKDPNKKNHLIQSKKSLLGLQAYLPSNGDRQSYILSNYDFSTEEDEETGASTSGRDQTTDPFTIDIQRYEGHLHSRNENNSDGTSSLEIHLKVRKDIEQATKMIVDYLNRFSGCQLLSLQAEFILDEDNRLWLSHIPHVLTRDRDRTLGMTPRSQSLPNLIPSSNNNNGASSSVSQAPSDTVSIAAGGGGIANGGGQLVKCRGEFCKVVPLTLKGLYSQQDNSSTNSPRGDESGRLDMVLKESGQRFKVGNNNVLLARAEMDFLTGKTLSFEQEELALRWQEADNIHRMEFGRTNPSHFYKQVPVCANCHRIYSKLARLREQGFLHTRKPGSNLTLFQDVLSKEDKDKDKEEEEEEVDTVDLPKKKGQLLHVSDQVLSSYGGVSKPPPAGGKKKAVSSKSKSFSNKKRGPISSDLRPSQDLLKFMGSETSPTSKQQQASEQEAEEEEDPEDPEDPSSSNVDYDAMFLAELAKHSEQMDVAGMNSSSKTKACTSTCSSSSPFPVSKSRIDQPSPPKETTGSGGFLPRVQTQKSSGTASISSLQLLKKKHQQHQPQASSSSSNSSGYMPPLVTNSTSSDQQMVQFYENKMESMAKELKQLKEELQQSRTKTHQVELNFKQMQQKMISTQQECTQLLQEKDDEMRRQKLEFEQLLNNVQMDQFNYSKKNKNNTRAEGSGNSAHNGQQPGAQDVTSMIETIDQLNAQLDRTYLEHETSKKQLIETHQMDILRLHDRYKLDFETLRLQDHQKSQQLEEMKISNFSLQNQLQVALTQAKQAKNALEEINLKKIPNLEEKNRTLEKQLNEQNAIVQAKKNEKNSNSNDTEALERHLNNKIDYLKAQIASEMRCKEELGANIANLTSTMENMKKEKKKALNEVEETHKRMIERLEERHLQENELNTSQIATCQAKIIQLQAHISDLVQENAASRNKEENAKLSMEKMVEENVRLTRQIVDLETQIEELQDKLEGSSKNSVEEAQRVNMEATLRRLDNERQYLKSQLDTEIASKEQLQKQFIQLEQSSILEKQSLTQQFQLVQQEISFKETENLREKQKLEEIVAIRDGEKQGLLQQLSETRANLLRLREQSLLDQSEMETLRGEMVKMKSSLIASKEELLKEREYAKQAAERTSKSMQTVKNSLLQVEEEKTNQIQQLQEQIVTYLAKISSTQQEMLQMEQLFQSKSSQLSQFHGASKLLSLMIQKFFIHGKQKAFVKWKTKVHQLKQIDLLQEQKETNIRLVEEKLLLDHAFSCERLTQVLHEEREEALQNVRLACEKEKEELEIQFQKQLAQLLEQKELLQIDQVNHLKKQYEEMMQQIKLEHTKNLELLEEKNQSLITLKQNELMNLEQKYQEIFQSKTLLQTNYDQLLVEMSQLKQFQMDNLQQMEQDYSMKMSGMHDTIVQREKELLKEHQEALAIVQQEHDLFIETLQKQLDQKARDQSNQLIENHDQLMQQTKQKFDLQLQEEIASINANWQKEIQNEREMANKNLREALERVEAKAQKQLDILRDEMKENKGTALLQTTAKWQKAMEEMQDRMEDEKKAAYQAGVSDREQEWQKAALQIKQKQKEELQNVQQQAMQAIKACEQKYELTLKTQMDIYQKEIDQKYHQQFENELTQLKELHAKEKESLSLVQKDAHALNLSQLEQDLVQQYEKRLDNLAHQNTLQLEALRLEMEENFKNDKQHLISTMDTSKSQALAQLEHLLNEKWTQEFTKLQNTNDLTFQEQMHFLKKQFEANLVSEQKTWEESKNLEIKSIIQQMEEQSQKEQEEAIAQVQEDSEKILEQVEIAMETLKKQKENIEKELSNVKHCLEEAEDQSFDLQEEIKQIKKNYAFTLLHCIAKASTSLTKQKQFFQENFQQIQTKYQHLQAEMDQLIQRHTIENDKFQKFSQNQCQVHETMYETLVSYKRDDLLEHRSASAVVSNDLSILDKQHEDMIQVKQKLEEEMKNMEEEAKIVEEQLRQVSQSSSLKDGHVNVALAAKKRRLNEEFEALLESMENKRTQIRNVDTKTTELQQKRKQKEDEMKVLERRLVEILVEQQRKMLQLVTAVRNETVPTVSS